MQHLFNLKWSHRSPSTTLSPKWPGGCKLLCPVLRTVIAAASVDIHCQLLNVPLVNPPTTQLNRSTTLALPMCMVWAHPV